MSHRLMFRASSFTLPVRKNNRRLLSLWQQSLASPIVRPSASTRAIASSSSAWNRPKSFNACFNIEPYKPAQSSVFYTDTSPDKFFIQIQITKKTKKDIESSYKQKDQLQPGSLVKLKIQENLTPDQHGSLSADSDGAAMGMTLAVSGKFGIIVRQISPTKDTWLVKTKDYDGLDKSLYIPRSQLSTRPSSDLECIFSFPTVQVETLVNNIRYMWPEHVPRESVVIMVDGKPIRQRSEEATSDKSSSTPSPITTFISSRDIIDGKVTVSINGAPPIPFINQGYKKGGNAVVASVVSKGYTVLKTFAYCWAGIWLVGAPVYFIVIEPYFGPFF